MRPCQASGVASALRWQVVDLVATEFTSVVFRILHYRNPRCCRVVQNPENHRNESGGGEIDSLLARLGSLMN